MSNNNEKRDEILGCIIIAIIVITVGFIAFFIGKGCRSTSDITHTSNKDYAMAIEKVYNQLEMYSAMADEQKNIREGSNMLAISIKKIDISNCPDDFRNAFNDLTNSYDDANQLMQKIPVSTSEKLSFVFVHLLDGEAWKMENSLKAIAEQIYEKQAKMNSVATKYGVIFDKDGNVVYRKIKQE